MKYAKETVQYGIILTFFFKNILLATCKHEESSDTDT